MNNIITELRTSNRKGRHHLTFLLALCCLSSIAPINAQTIDEVLASGACPLNSGGPSLLGTRWRLMSLYENEVPRQLNMTMEVEQTEMVGRGGCNTYAAHFVQVGNRGFKVNKIERGPKPCEVLPTVPGGPTVHVGDWEGQYLRVLGRAGSVAQMGSVLQFYDANGRPSLVFAKLYGERVRQPDAAAPATKPETTDPAMPTETPTTPTPTTTVPPTKS